MQEKLSRAYSVLRMNLLPPEAVPKEALPETDGRHITSCSSLFEFLTGVNLIPTLVYVAYIVSRHIHGTQQGQ